jgi:hypothetical protein
MASTRVMAGSHATHARTQEFSGGQQTSSDDGGTYGAAEIIFAAAVYRKSDGFIRGIVQRICCSLWGSLSDP